MKKFKFFAAVLMVSVMLVATGCADGCFPDAGGLAKPEKPIIYLYPEAAKRVTVELPDVEKLLYTYPKYESAWEVTAQPNGDLTDLKTGRSLYALYYESTGVNGFNMQEGFVIEGKDTITFLEEKLAVLGLNEREANEFVIYWLPRLESNRYNYIRFQTYEEIESNMRLKITPVPDTLIRVMMEFKPLNQKIEVTEQVLTPASPRVGFVAVEWGGTEIISV